MPGDTLEMTDLHQTSQPNNFNDPSRSLHWQHYSDAFRIYSKFLNDNFSKELQKHRKNNSDKHVRVDDIEVTEENKSLPIDGYLAFYCDLLAFSAEIIGSGTDSLPDFYGAAFVYASQNPDVQVYLLSDSCLAFAHKDNADNFLSFVSSIFGELLADGMLPQCFIGYGSFAERKPYFGPIPANFFGTQVTGTALVDAVNIQKSYKPLGSRILLSESAIDNLPAGIRVAKDIEGAKELFCDRPLQFCLFDCIYYLLRLRSLEPGTRPFDHCIWSVASRTMASRNWILEIARGLVEPLFDGSRFAEIVDSINSVLNKFELISVEAGIGGSC